MSALPLAKGEAGQSGLTTPAVLWDGREPLPLGLGWRLTADTQQWIVQKFAGGKWRSIAFVGSNKTVLMRVLREAGVEVAPNALEALGRLPDRFKEWRADRDRRKVA
jgi:hypothetical protein